MTLESIKPEFEVW